MKNSNPVATQQFLDKADHFLQGMRLLSDDLPEYRSAIALLAVHSAISLNDGITVAIKGRLGKYQDHSAAKRTLDRICSDTNLKDRKGTTHLEWLLARKSDFAYGQGRLDDSTIKQAVDKAEKFSAWAYNHFQEVLLREAATA